MPGPTSPPEEEDPSRRSARTAESALRRLGFSRIPAEGRGADLSDFWVEYPGAPRRRYAVFVDEFRPAGRPGRDRPPAILVVPDEERAREAWESIRRPGGSPVEPDVSILVLSRGRSGPSDPHWHAGVVDRKTLPSVATGVIVGLFRRSAGSGEGPQIDFEEMLRILRTRFHIDLPATLGTESTEDSLWMMYQLALRYAYAPGDSASGLHALVLKPTGPAARLPWFAA